MVTRSICSTLSTPNLQALEASCVQRRAVPATSPRTLAMAAAQKHSGTSSSFQSSSWSEAPARLGTSPRDGLYHRRSRSRSVPDDAFCALDQLSPMTRVVTGTDLATLLERADSGMRSGVRPFLAEGAMGGTYFFRDMTKKICVVFKPSDEEPMAPNNPHQQSHKYGAAYKGHITPGFGMFRELATYIIDRGMAGVPPTAIARARHQCFSKGSDATDHKIGSVQSYLRHECSAEEMGPSKFDTRSVQSIAILDLRLCNQDRHAGNILVCEKNPYRASGLRPLVVEDLNGTAMPAFPATVSSTCSDDPFPFHLEDIEAMTELVRESSSESGDLLSATDPDVPSLSKKRPCSRQSPAGSPHNPRTLSRRNDSDVDVDPVVCAFPLGSLPRSSAASRTTTESSVDFSDVDVQPGKYALAPIDHGYCLPHVLYTGEAVFAWLDWPQAREPLPAELEEYIRSLNADEEAEAIRRCIGAALPSTALLTLKVCTYLLQQGVAAGWTLADIGRVMVREVVGQLSQLETLINKCMNKIRQEHGSYELNTTLSPRQRSIAEDERLLCEYSEKFVGYVQTSIDALIAAGPAPRL